MLCSVRMPETTLHVTCKASLAQATQLGLNMAPGSNDEIPLLLHALSVNFFPSNAVDAQSQLLLPQANGTFLLPATSVHLKQPQKNQTSQTSTCALIGLYALCEQKNAEAGAMKAAQRLGVIILKAADLAKGGEYAVNMQEDNGLQYRVRINTKKENAAVCEKNMIEFMKADSKRATFLGLQSLCAFGEIQKGLEEEREKRTKNVIKVCNAMQAQASVWNLMASRPGEEGKAVSQHDTPNVHDLRMGNLMASSTGHVRTGLAPVSQHDTPNVHGFKIDVTQANMINAELTKLCLEPKFFMCLVTQNRMLAHIAQNAGLKLQNKCFSPNQVRKAVKQYVKTVGAHQIINDFSAAAQATVVSTQLRMYLHLRWWGWTSKELPRVKVERG